MLAEAVPNQEAQVEPVTGPSGAAARRGVDHLVAKRPSPDRQLGGDWAKKSDSLCVGNFAEIVGEQLRHWAGEQSSYCQGQIALRLALPSAVLELFFRSEKMDQKR